MKIPLMSDNITQSDRSAMAAFLLQEPAPILTNHARVRQFEKEWGEWLGMPRNVMVNSGSSANELTMLALKQFLPPSSEIIVPPITWVSDIASVIHNGFKPVFCDINMSTLAIDEDELEKKITPNTRAVFLTHVLGFNGLTDKILELCNKHRLILIEDVCESHGATFKGKKVGTFGEISNFSFYYAHHMTSIEGGMISTTKDSVYEFCRMARSHGMAREAESNDTRKQLIENNPILNKDFIFVEAAYNFRSTEINAVLASQQLKRLTNNNEQRAANLAYFLSRLNAQRYHVDFNTEGNSSYAFTPILKSPCFNTRDRVEQALTSAGIEFRRGLSGGGNQLYQPYLQKYMDIDIANIHREFPNATHCHHFGWYIGNYPGMTSDAIQYAIATLNSI